MYFTTFLLKNLLRRRIRTLLTCLGIAVAVGTTISLLGLSDNFKRESHNAFSSRDTHILVLEKGVLDQLSSDVPEISVAMINAIPEVLETAPGLLQLVSTERPEGTLTFVLQGWEPNSYLFDSLKFVDGRAIQHGDTKKVMIGIKIAELLSLQVGDSYEIPGTNEQYEVVGIFDSTSVQENRCAIVTLKQMQEEVAFRKNSLTGISVRVKGSPPTEKEIEEVCAKINALVDANNKPMQIAAESISKYVENAIHLKIAQAMAWLTSMIAIVVGAIGMLNTMVMSVVERTKEISILRAIGWRKSRVIRMIVGESLMISVFGAGIGAACATILIRWLATWDQVAGYLSGEIATPIYMEGFVLAGIVGLLGGLYPALRAASLMPSEGLRHE
jgi:putative ABC transport system permease protein